MTYTNFSGKTSVCTANITRKKSRIKAYGTHSSSVSPIKYHLQDGEEFEIELFNPTHYQVLAKIKLNGKLISSSGIVLLPGQRVFLERFIDDNQKFLYKTYEVEDTKESKDAISHNGDVSVEFFHEVTHSTFTISNPYYPYGSTLRINSSGGSFGNPLTWTAGLDGITYDASSGIVSNTTTSTFFDASNASLNTSRAFNTSSYEAPKSVETGRVQGGTASNQSFETVYGNFNSFPATTIFMKIMPESQKPAEVSELRNYCPGCRSRIKKTTWKYCPSCGEEL